MPKALDHEYTRFGEVVRELKLTHAQVGKEIGCSAQHVGNFMRGDQTPSLDMAFRIEEFGERYGREVRVSTWKNLCKSFRPRPPGKVARKG